MMNTTLAAAPPIQASRRFWQAGGDFLSFRLGAEEYGIDILRVREIRSYETPTRVAHLPPAIKGVVNLHGVIVPMLDLRMLLACERCDYGLLTAVIMLSLHGRTVGAVVDSVCEVLALGPAMIQPPPQFEPGPGTGRGPEHGPARGHPGGPAGRYVGGIGQSADRCLLLLDIDTLMAHAETCMATLQA